MSGLDSKDLDPYDDGEPQAATTAAPGEQDSGIDVRIPTPAPENDDTTLDDLLDDAKGDQRGCDRAEGAS